MKVWEVIIVAIGISLDAFTVAICRGATQSKLEKLKVLGIGIVFSMIQSLMLTAGMEIGRIPMLNIDSNSMIRINQWFSALILFYIGIKTIKNSTKVTEMDEKREEYISYKKISMLALAIGIDTFVLGIGLALLQTALFYSVIILFVITCILVILGIWIGYRMGDKFRLQINIIGGSILIVMGVKTILTYFAVI